MLDQYERDQDLNQNLHYIQISSYRWGNSKMVKILSAIYIFFLLKPLINTIKMKGMQTREHTAEITIMQRFLTDRTPIIIYISNSYALGIICTSLR